MFKPNKYVFVPLDERFQNSEDWDYSVNPHDARVTSEEYIRLSEDKPLTPFSIACQVVKHFVWLKQKGLVDYYISTYQPLNSSGPEGSHKLNITVGLVDNQLRWDLLNMDERIKLVKRHFNDFLIINYCLSALQDKLGKVELDLIATSVNSFLKKEP